MNTAAKALAISRRPPEPAAPSTRQAALARSQSGILKVSAMIRFYFHPTPNPAKVALFLKESGLTYKLVPVDTSKGEQHQPSFRAVNPNGKVPAIVDTEGPGGQEARVFDTSAILLYLAEKAGRFLGQPADQGELLSWLFFLGTGLGPFS
jgi:GST-like protein